MPVRRRSDKRREALDDDAVAWLQGDMDGARFFQFLPHEQLVDFWDAYGDPRTAAWDKIKNTNPRPARIQ